MRARRWEPCIEHRGEFAEKFLRDLFKDERRQCCLVAGAGFDRRAPRVATLLASTLGERLSGLFLREERGRAPRLRKLAEKNLDLLLQVCPAATVREVKILADDNAVIAGRNAVLAIQDLDLNPVTDVVVDISAMSLGVASPIVQQLLAQVDARGGQPNLHVLLTSSPDDDDQRAHVSNDEVSLVHGLQGTFRLHGHMNSAKLWIPQLSTPKRAALERIHAWDQWDDICPILPFPSRDPRRGDVVSEAFIRELDSAWDVDPRNVIYVGEDDPVDVYRTILRIEEQRRPVFAETIGSSIVLSPIGSKAVALGAVMAAIERSLAVAYVEAISYDVPSATEDGVNDTEGQLIHVWLQGEAYPAPTPQAAP